MGGRRKRVCVEGLSLFARLFWERWSSSHVLMTCSVSPFPIVTGHHGSPLWTFFRKGFWKRLSTDQADHNFILLPRRTPSSAQVAIELSSTRVSMTVFRAVRPFLACASSGLLVRCLVIKFGTIHKSLHFRPREGTHTLGVGHGTLTL